MKLLNCPDCGPKCTCLKNEGNTVHLTGGRDMYGSLFYVICSCCGLRTPICKTPAQANEIWKIIVESVTSKGLMQRVYQDKKLDLKIRKFGNN